MAQPINGSTYQLLKLLMAQLIILAELTAI